MAALLLSFGSTAPTLAAPGPKPSSPGQEKKEEPPAAKPDKAKEDKPTPPEKAKEDKPTPPEKAKEDKPAPPGKAKEADKGKPKPDQDAAQDAVEAEQALPLVEIVKIAKSLKQGRVVNARLLRVNGALLYQLTMLDEDGHSWRDYYLARSGNPVDVR